jgi:hypothetical protein
LTGRGKGETALCSSQYSFPSILLTLSILPNRS